MKMKNKQALLYLVILIENSVSQYHYLGSLFPSDYMHLIESFNEHARNPSAKKYKHHRSYTSEEDCNCSCGRCNPPSKCCENICVLCKAQFDEPKVVYMPVPYNPGQVEHQGSETAHAYMNQKPNFHNHQYQRFYEHAQEPHYPQYEGSPHQSPIHIEIMPQLPNHAHISTVAPINELPYEHYEASPQISPIHIDIISQGGNYVPLTTVNPIKSTTSIKPTTSIKITNFRKTTKHTPITSTESIIKKASCQEPSFKSILNGEDECNLLRNDEVVKSQIFEDIHSEKKCNSSASYSNGRCVHDDNGFIPNGEIINNIKKNKRYVPPFPISYISEENKKHSLKDQHYQSPLKLHALNPIKKYNLDNNHLNKYEGEQIFPEIMNKASTDHNIENDYNLSFKNIYNHNYDEKPPNLHIITDQHGYPNQKDMQLRIRTENPVTHKEDGKKYLLTTIRKTDSDIFPDYGIVPITNSFAKKLLEDYGSIKVLQPARKTLDHY